ncbi:hypothetical protein, partial [Solicola sp. PLA-1-18]|uniref:hypothetical protein n=1 Tax=Solicola sp. PLA-1-18 TaxID=3380532 RepID=UPI003B7AF3A2
FFALDWKYGWVFTYQSSLSTGPASDIVDATWFTWVFAAVGLVLGLLGLWWLAAHARRPHQSSVRLKGSDDHGRLEADLTSIAAATAERFDTMTPTQSVSGRTRSYGSKQVVELRARLDPRADGESIGTAARTCTQDVATALPDGDATCRIVLDGPSRSKLVRKATGSTARVH